MLISSQKNLELVIVFAKCRFLGNFELRLSLYFLVSSMSALVEQLENLTEERQTAVEQLKLAQTHLQIKKEELEISEELRQNAEEILKTTKDKLEIADNQFQNVKTELQITEKEVARLKDTIEYLENDQPGSGPSSSSAGHVIISLIRRVNDARETDTCLGNSLGSGYITAQFRVHIFSNVCCSENICY